MAAPSLERRAARRVGVTLRGKYRIERVLGEGGMATVYAAVHRNGNRVAVKMLHEELSRMDDIRARFLREGYVANRVGHPGAVRVIEDDVDEDGSAFLVMELLFGETLRARCLRLGGKLGCREVLALGHQLLDVLGAAHAAGIVHRDVKPDNLFLTTERALKVLDFGIARLEDDPGAHATAIGTRLGTPAFMPPELALGRTAEVDGRTDLWSCGATLFTLLSGRIVHDADASAEVVVRAATQPARPLGEVAPDVAPAVAAVVDHALQFARDDRWPTARAMQQALDDAHAAVYGETIGRDAIGAVPAPGEPPVAPGEPLDPTERAPSGAASDEATRPYPSNLAVPPGNTTHIPPSTSAARPPERVVRPRRRLAAVAALLLALAGVAAPFVVGRRSKTPAHAAAPSSAPACASNAACVSANGGRPSVCRRADGACVRLESEDCTVLAGEGDVTNDATVWIGAMWPTHDPDPHHFGRLAANAVELARRDFAETSGGLLPARPGGPRRPLGVVLCDDHADAERAARHLVRDVRVPAVLGFGSSKEVLDLATSLFVPEGVLAVCTTNTATTLRSIPHAPGAPRLVWRTTIATDMASWPLAAIVEHVVEPALRAAPGLLAPGEPIRVVQLRQNTLAGQTSIDSRIAELRFNGKSVAENGDAFRQIARPDGAGDAELEAASLRTAREVVAFLPHVVIDLPPTPALVMTIERLWPASAPFRPRYVAEGTFNDPGGPSSADWRRFDLYRRLFSVDFPSDNPPLLKLVLRYDELFSPRVTPVTAPNTAYDGFYVVAYAIAAVGDEAITGTALARAIPRLLPPGEPVDVGPNGVYPTLYALAAGRNVDLRGTATSLDFDLETGEPRADLALHCLSPGSANEPARYVESGVRFDVRARRMTGTLRCP